MNSFSKAHRVLALSGVAISILILIPGLFLPVLTVSGNLNPAGVADLAYKILEQGMTDAAVQSFRPMINPDMLPVLDSSKGGLKGTLVTAIGNQLSNQLKTGKAIE